MTDLAPPTSFASNGNGRGRRFPERPPVGVLFDKQPPHSLEAEMSLLGSMLLDPQVIGEVVSIVQRPDQFYSEAHGAIFASILAVYDKHASGDIVQIVEHLRDKGVIERVGGHAYLIELAERVPSAVNAPHYARIVAEKAKLRDLIAAASQILYETYHAGELDLDGGREVVDRAEQAIFDIAEKSETSEAEALKDLLAQQIELIEAAERDGVSGYKTGFDDLDEKLSGLQPGEMIILAARPSMGKTAMALNIAEQVAFGGRTPWSPPGDYTPTPVGVFSLEMSRQALAARMLSARSGIDAHSLRTGRLTMDDWQRLNRAAGELYEAPIYIDDTPGLTILAMRAKARRMARKHGVKVLIVDYLQLLSSPAAAREGRQNEVSTISRQIKALARELNVPVVCLAQLNRAAEQREGNRPRMSDLRESGSIEQDADVVLLLHREAYYHKDDPAWFEENPDKANLTELIVAKQRNGPTGVVKLTFDSATTRFKNYDHHHSYADAVAYQSIASRQPAVPPTYAQPAPPPPSGDPAPPRRVGFAPGPKTGPVADHRDGGGSDANLDDEFNRYSDEELPPF